jgi:DUF1680 family protein
MPAPVTRHAPIPERFRPLPLGAIRPTGWLRAQLQENLAGCVGHLDQLAPALVVDDQIYGRDRLSPAVRHKDVGAQGVPKHDQPQLLWWNSETQSNWWDGLVRTAVLLGDEVALRRAADQVAALIATQDADGYLGIYDAALRYTMTGENGELWAKATALRYVLAWYDYTGEPHILHAVARALDELMLRYPIGASHPFRTEHPFSGGLTHGLAITDVFEQMGRITGDRRYAEYIAFLYDAFSREPLAEDGRLSLARDPGIPLRGHGVHSYEQLRSIAAAYHASGNPALGEAMEVFAQKIARCITPAGGPIGDEFINGTEADATHRGYETCSLQELLHSYGSLLIKQGAAAWGDAMERLFLNAAQGARHPDGRSIAYLTCDNAYAMTGPRHGDTSHPEQTRYRYSPVHQEAAVCCVPNAGRIAPTYVQHMWLREGDTLVCALLGPCELRTTVRGHAVHITVETTYPAEDSVRLTVHGATAGLALKVRRPAWSTSVQASAPLLNDNGFLLIDIPPATARVAVHLSFGAALVAHQDRLGHTYFTHGPCVLAHRLDAQPHITRRYAVPGFCDVSYTARQDTRYLAASAASATPIGGRLGHWQVALVNAATHTTERVELVPMAHTILRQITFPPCDPSVVRP